jgi:hypothetical protein
VLGCCIRSCSLAWGIGPDFSRNLTIGGFATIPAFIAIFLVYDFWRNHEADTACLDVPLKFAARRFTVPNAPFVLLPGENPTPNQGAINHRLRARCYNAAKLSPIPVRNFSLDLTGNNGWPDIAPPKICAGRMAGPRWLIDTCTIVPRGTLAATKRASDDTHLPLRMSVSEDASDHYTLVEEHKRRIANRAQRPYREVSATNNYFVYVELTEPHHSETTFYISRNTRHPEVFACRNAGNNADGSRRCHARYVQDGIMIAYEFETLSGHEEEKAAKVDIRVSEILTELTVTSDLKSK